MYKLREITYISELDELNISERNRILKEYIECMENKRKEIQDKFSFEIPTYILDEIIESAGRHREDNINCLINAAIINDRISEEDAYFLKNEFVFHNNTKI